ncbi:hypothetical protein FQA39_LY17093 [Lamprigera yunnana]|nr:hypothetical protein FQA39_LY17093 [Lamprigera yunnana]
MHLALVDISNNNALIRIGRKLETSRAMIDDYVPPPRRKGKFLLESDLTCLDALNPTTTCGSLQSSGSTRWKLSYASKLDASSRNLVITSNTETRALPSTLSTYLGTCRFLMHLALVDISNNNDLIRIGRKLETSRAMIDDYVPPPRRKGKFLLESDLTCLDALNPTTTCGSLQSSGSTRLAWEWNPGGPGPPGRPSGYPTPRGSVLQVGMRDKRVLPPPAQWFSFPLGVAPDCPPLLCQKQHTSSAVCHSWLLQVATFASTLFAGIYDLHLMGGPGTRPLGDMLTTAVDNAISDKAHPGTRAGL